MVVVVDVARPIADVVPGVRGAVLGALARMTEARTGRQLARDAGQAPSSTARVIDDLVDAGLVVRVAGGRDNSYRLNREHIAAPAIMALASLRGELLNRMRTEIAHHPEVVAAWLFGSAARGDGTRDSDLDVLIVAGDDRDVASAAGDLATATQAWTGNPVQVVEHTLASFAALVAEGNPLVVALRTDGIELVDGSNRLLRGRRG